MKSRTFRALACAGALLSAAALSGCGEIANTITPEPGTANTLTVALPTTPNANYVGIYDAQALGYFAQTDLNVRLVSPTSGTTDTLPGLYNGNVEVALSTEPGVLLARNENEALVSIGAVVHGELKTVTTTTVKRGSSRAGGVTGKGRAATGHHHVATTTSKTATTSTGSAPVTHIHAVKVELVPDQSLLPASLQNRTDLPPYNGLVVVARKSTIVNDAPLLRRFVQAVGRGYEAAREDPVTATRNMVAAVPALARTAAQQLAAVKALMPFFFPVGNHPWGWQSGSQWNAFGTWLSTEHLITNPNATPDASTNELLAGEGV